LRSKFEERLAADLKKRGIEYIYEAQAFTYMIPRKYTPDFRVKAKGALAPIWVEAKGYLTPGDRAKTLAVLAAHPGIDLRFVFQRASNKLGKGSKSTYASWCDKHGIPWAEGTIPKAWLD